MALFALSILAELKALDKDVLMMLLGIVFGGIALLIPSGAMLVAWVSDLRSKKALAAATVAQASGKRADLELSGGTGDLTARQLLEKAVLISEQSLIETAQARVASQGAEVSALQAADASRGAEGKCLALGAQISETSATFLSHVARLDGRIDEQGHRITEFGAKASEALQLARALESGRRAADKALIAAATEGPKEVG